MILLNAGLICIGIFIINILRWNLFTKHGQCGAHACSGIYKKHKNYYIINAYKCDRCGKIIWMFLYNPKPATRRTFLIDISDRSESIDEFMTKIINEMKKVPYVEQVTEPSTLNNMIEKYMICKINFGDIPLGDINRHMQYVIDGMTDKLLFTRQYFIPIRTELSSIDFITINTETGEIYSTYNSLYNKEEAMEYLNKLKEIDSLYTQ